MPPPDENGLADHVEPTANHTHAYVLPDHTHEHTGWRRWTPLFGYLILFAAFLVTVTLHSQAIKNNRDLIRKNAALAERLATDCVDRDGDISYREVLTGLIRLNENREPLTGKRFAEPLTEAERQRWTIRILEDGLQRAGPVPPCVANLPRG